MWGAAEIHTKPKTRHIMTKKDNVLEFHLPCFQKRSVDMCMGSIIVNVPSPHWKEVDILHTCCVLECKISILV